MSTALVTGASAGIGRAFADGARPPGPRPRARRPRRARLDALAEELVAGARRRGRGARRRPLDPEGLATVEARLADTAHPVDILVNNAGFGTFGAFAELDIEREVRGDRAQRGRAAAADPRRARRRWKRGARGAILNVAVAGRVPAGAEQRDLRRHQGVRHSFTHAVHEEARGTGVHVMLVCPGYTHTEFHERAGLGAIGVPEIVWQSADQVVAAALRDLDRGRSVSIPGAMNGGGRAVEHGPGRDHAARRGGRQAIGVTGLERHRRGAARPHTDSLPVDVR